MPGTTSTESLTAFDAAQALLASKSTSDLLRAAYLLTHRMHAHGSEAAHRGYRQQRDMIDAEILRRADRPHLAIVPTGVSA